MSPMRQAFLAKRNDPNSGGRDAEGNPGNLRRVSPSLPKCQVVFAGSAFVGMSLYRDANLRNFLSHAACFSSVVRAAGLRLDLSKL